VHRAWGMGHGAWGIGHGAWGMGHGAWGMGHWALGIGHTYQRNRVFYRICRSQPVFFPKKTRFLSPGASRTIPITRNQDTAVPFPEKSGDNDILTRAIDNFGVGKPHGAVSSIAVLSSHPIARSISSSLLTVDCSLFTVQCQQSTVNSQQSTSFPCNRK